MSKPCRGRRSEGEVRVGIAEGVVDLVEHGAQTFIAVVAEPDRDRVEGVAENPREHQHAHRATVEVDAGTSEVPVEPHTEIRAIARAVVAVVERHEVEPVAREDRIAACEVVDLVEVDQHRPHAVLELVAHRLEPPVADDRLVDGRGGHAGTRSRSGAAWTAAVDRGTMSSCQGAGAPSAAATVKPD